MKIKELKKMIKDAFIAEAEFTNAETFYEPMGEDYNFLDEANKTDDMTFIANLEKELAEGLTEEKLDPETKEVLYPLEDLRTQAKESGDQKLETLINNAILMVNKYMITPKVKDGKTLNLKALKAAIEKGDFDAFAKFQRNPYLGPDPYIAEDLYEAEEEEEVKVKVDAEEETTDGKKEKNDSIVVGKKIVSLSSLPDEKRDILDSLETLRAQAEEFGDQKFETQVGNTITFFTRDFVVDTPTKEKVDEVEDQEEKYVGDDEKYEYEKGKEAGKKLNESIIFPLWNKIK
jgi:hypothetical protein